MTTPFALKGAVAGVPTTAPPPIAAVLFSTLTQHERDVAHLVYVGLSNEEIGRQLNISDGTVKLHLHNAYQKLAIANRTALACLCLNDARQK